MTKSAMTQEKSHEKISYDLSKVKFVLWTAKNGANSPWEFKAGVDPKELLKRHFNPSQPTKFIAHGWTRNWKEAKPFVKGNSLTLLGPIDNFNYDPIISPMFLLIQIQLM